MTPEPAHAGAAAPRPPRSLPEPTLAGTVALGFAGSAAMAIGGTLAGGGDLVGDHQDWFWAVPVIPVRPAVDLLPALASWIKTTVRPRRRRGRLSAPTAGSGSGRRGNW